MLKFRLTWSMAIWVEILTGWLGAHDLEGYTR